MMGKIALQHRVVLQSYFYKLFLFLPYIFVKIQKNKIYILIVTFFKKFEVTTFMSCDLFLRKFIFLRMVVSRIEFVSL